MKNYSFWFTAVLFFFLTAPDTALAEEAIKIVYYSGNPEIQTDRDLGGIPALAGLLTQLRTREKNVLFFHGGRALAPSTLSSFDRGTHMVDLLNRLKPDVFSVGKSELAYREDELTLRSREASFPFLSANLFDPLTNGQPEGIKPYLILKVNGFNLGVFSMTSPELMDDYLLDRVTLTNYQETISQTSETLRSQGADLVVLMCDYLSPLFKRLCSEKVVDIILVSDVDAAVLNNSNSVMIVHDRSDTAVILDLHLERSNESVSWQYSIDKIKLDQIAPEPEIKKITHSFLSKLEQFLLVPIGITETQIDTRKEMVRTSENGFGNFIADSLRSFFKADIALMNGGGIRGNKIYPPGSVLTRGDMLREIPFRNHAVRIEVTGSQLREALENGFSRIEDKKGRFPHVSGMTVRYNPAAAPLSRVRSILVGGRELKLNQTYSLATVNFLAAGGDGYTVFKNCPRSDKYGSSRLLWEYVRDGIAGSKRIAPTIEGRLIQVSD